MNRPPVAMMAFAGILVLAVYGSGFYYVGRKVYTFLRLAMEGSAARGGINHMPVFIAICAFFAVSVAVSFIPASMIGMAVKKNLVWFAWLLVGSLLILLMFFLASELALLIGRLTKLITTPTPPGAVIAAGCIVFALSVIFVSCAVYNAKQIRHVSYDVMIEKPSSVGSLNAVLISDTHLDYLNDEKWLAKVAFEVNSLNPDIVFIAGDIFNNTYRNLQNPGESLKALQSIKTKYGIYAVPGNHDGGDTYPEMLDFLRRGGVTMLHDEHITIADSFIVVGRVDPMPIGGGVEPRKDAADVLITVSADNMGGLPVIVIDHQPGYIREYGKDVDLILAGHTHAGIFFPATTITYLMNKEFNYGYVHETADIPHVIVTSGAGLWGPPFRLGSNNEVVSIDIKFAVQ